MVISFVGVIVVVSSKASADPHNLVSDGSSALLAPFIGGVFAFVPAHVYSINGLLAFSLRPLHFTVQLFHVALAMLIISSLLGLA